jgi:hypothetical protein
MDLELRITDKETVNALENLSIYFKGLEAESVGKMPLHVVIKTIDMLYKEVKSIENGKKKQVKISEFFQSQVQPSKESGESGPSRITRSMSKQIAGTKGLGMGNSV